MSKKGHQPAEPPLAPSLDLLIVGHLDHCVPHPHPYPLASFALTQSYMSLKTRLP